MIVVIGDLMLDVFLLPRLIHAEQPAGIALRAGGSAANTAAWIANLGGDVTFVGCVGRDAVGKMLVDELKAGGVRGRVRRVEAGETGAVAIEVTPEGERVMRGARGANADLTPDDIARCPSDNVSVVHLTGYTLLNAYGLEMLAAAGRLARSSGATLSFDPSSRSVVETFGAEPLLEAMAEARVGIHLPNAEEARALTGSERTEEAAAALADSIPAVIVKDGARGAVHSSEGETVRIPTDPVSPLDTTGAGDAFNAGALVAVAQWKTLSAACLQGHSASRQVLRRYGGRPEGRLRIGS